MVSFVRYFLQVCYVAIFCCPLVDSFDKCFTGKAVFRNGALTNISDDAGYLAGLVGGRCFSMAIVKRSGENNVTNIFFNRNADIPILPVGVKLKYNSWRNYEAEQFILTCDDMDFCNVRGPENLSESAVEKALDIPLSEKEIIARAHEVYSQVLNMKNDQKREVIYKTNKTTVGKSKPTIPATSAKTKPSTSATTKIGATQGILPQVVDTSTDAILTTDCVDCTTSESTPQGGGQGSDSKKEGAQESKEQSGCSIICYASFALNGIFLIVIIILIVVCCRQRSKISNMHDKPSTPSKPSKRDRDHGKNTEKSEKKDANTVRHRSDENSSHSSPNGKAANEKPKGQQVSSNPITPEADNNPKHPEGSDNKPTEKEKEPDQANPSNKGGDENPEGSLIDEAMKNPAYALPPAKKDKPADKAGSAKSSSKKSAKKSAKSGKNAGKSNKSAKKSGKSNTGAGSKKSNKSQGSLIDEAEKNPAYPLPKN